MPPLAHLLHLFSSLYALPSSPIRFFSFFSRNESLIPYPLIPCLRIVPLVVFEEQPLPRSSLVPHSPRNHPRLNGVN